MKLCRWFPVTSRTGPNACSTTTPAPQATPAAEKTRLEQLFHTGWFVESLLTQTLIVHIIRTNRIPFLQSRASRPMLLTTLAVMALGIWLPFSSFAGFLGFTRLPAVWFVWIAGFLVAYGILTHAVKSWFNRRFGTD